MMLFTRVYPDRAVQDRQENGKHILEFVTRDPSRPLLEPRPTYVGEYITLGLTDYTITGLKYEFHDANPEDGAFIERAVFTVTP